MSTPSVNRAPGAIEQVRALYPSLSASAKRVADLVLASPADVVPMSASHLASATQSSVGTVVRFCQASGFSGYQDFKNALTAATSTALSLEAVAQRQCSGTVDRVLTATLVSLARSVDSIDARSVHCAADVLRAARRILIPSAGPSQPLATTFAQMLQIAGYSVTHPVDVHTQIAVAEQLSSEDVCFVISHSGATKQTLQAAEAADAAGARLVALTGFATSPLARMADVAIVAGAPADRFRSTDRASRPVQLTVLQALFAVIEHGAA